MCCSWAFWDAVFAFYVHCYSVIVIFLCRCCCCWLCVDRISTLGTTLDNKVGIYIHTNVEGRFTRSLEHFIFVVRYHLGWRESLFKFEWLNLIPRPAEQSVTIVVVPAATRLGIDVDHALEEIKTNQAWEKNTKVVLILHSQAPHLPDVRPSRLQLTDSKYDNLAAILDLQLHEGEMRRHCPFNRLNKSMAMELSTLLLKQQAQMMSENQPLRK